MLGIFNSLELQTIVLGIFNHLELNCLRLRTSVRNNQKFRIQDFDVKIHH